MKETKETKSVPAVKAAEAKQEKPAAKPASKPKNKPALIVNEKIEENSDKILQDLVREARHSQNPTTRIGRIAEVRKAADYETTKHRLFVISYNGGYVFMNEPDAPEWLIAKKRLVDIQGKEVQFKAKYVDEHSRIYVSSRAVNSKYEDAMKKGEILRGTVVGIDADEKDHANDSLMINCKGDVLYMPRAELSVVYFPYELTSKIGLRMTFVVKAIDAGRVIISHKVIEDSARDKMIEELKGGASVEAVIMQVKPWGAKLFCRGVLMLLRNKDFSSDFTKVSAVKKKGDLMIVKLAEVSQSKRIFVQPLEKFSTPVQINFDIFKVGQIILGEVAAVPAFGAFVNIAPGIDVLCPIPQSGREPAVGDKVKIRILQVRKEEHRIRGKIVGFLEKAEDEEAAKPEEKPEKDGEVK